MKDLIIALGDTVNIIGTELSGKVTGILLEPENSVQYRVRLWKEDSADQYQHWVYDFEIKKKIV